MNFTKAVAVPNKPVGDYYHGKLQLIVPLPHNTVVGESVKVNGSIYKGIFKVTYIYVNNASKIAALYFGDVPFAGNDTGTIEKLTSSNPVVSTNPVEIKGNSGNPAIVIPTASQQVASSESKSVSQAAAQPIMQPVNQPIAPVLKVAELSVMPDPVKTSLLQNPLVQIILGALGIVLLFKIINK